MGANTHAAIHEIAQLLGKPPIRIFRAALASGIWGKEPALSPAEIATLRMVLEAFPDGLDEAPISGTIGPTSGPLGAG